MNLFRILLATNIKRARNLTGMTQQELAEKCQISTNYLANIEIGKKFPSAESLEKISKALRLRPYQLFLGDDDVTAYNRQELIERITKKTKDYLIKTIEKVYTDFTK